MSLFSKKLHIPPDTIAAPVAGNVIPLTEIADPVFSEGVLGKGCGIEPSSEEIAAPFDGKVAAVADTRHAVGFISKSGIELLIHVGIDTVEMKGDGFQVFVQDGDRVKCGERVMTFSADKIKAAGHAATVAIVVTNTDDYTDVLLLGRGLKAQSEEILRVSK